MEEGNDRAEGACMHVVTLKKKNDSLPLKSEATFLPPYFSLALYSSLSLPMPTISLIKDCCMVVAPFFSVTLSPAPVLATDDGKRPNREA